MEVYKDYPYVTIGWDNVSKTVIVQWKGGFVRALDFKAGMDEVLVFLSSKKASRVMGDTRNLGILSNDTQKWVAEDWFPRFFSAGARYNAIVVSSEALTKMSLDAILSNEQSGGVVNHYFDNQDAALKWLKEQK